MPADRKRLFSMRSGTVNIRIAVSALAIFAVSIASCRLVDPHDPNDIRLSVGASGYLIGDSAMLTLRNESGRTIAYNLCLANLERQNGGEWVPLTHPGSCPSAQATLTHGEQGTYAYLLRSSLQPGTYRFVYTFAPAGDDELTLISNRFDVDEASQP